MTFELSNILAVCATPGAWMTLCLTKEQADPTHFQYSEYRVG
jgi:hypothetical protein